jgi:hypothetical protein
VIDLLEEALSSPKPSPEPHVDTFVAEEPKPGEKHWHRMEFPVFDTVEMKAGRQFAIHRCRCGKLSPKPYLVTRPKASE